MSNTSRARLAVVMAVVHFVPHLYEKEVMAPAPARPSPIFRVFMMVFFIVIIVVSAK